MAKIRLGSVVAQISGSLDGITFSHNRNGRYVRARVKPTNPKSAKQQQVRSQLGTLSQSYRTLTPAQRTGWISLGAQMTQTNSIGEATTLTGAQAYISVNQLRLTAGLTVVTAAPSLDSAPTATLSNLQITTTTPLVNLTLPGGQLATGQTLRVYMTGPMSAGRQYIRASQYRYLQNVVFGYTTTVALLTAWSATYGAPVAGMIGSKVSLKIIPVSANGLAGPSIRIDTVISAT